MLIYNSTRHEIRVYLNAGSKFTGDRYTFVHGLDRKGGQTILQDLTEDQVNVYLKNFRANHLRLWIKTGDEKILEGHKMFYNKLIEAN